LVLWTTLVGGPTCLSVFRSSTRALFVTEGAFGSYPLAPLSAKDWQRVRQVQCAATGSPYLPHMMKLRIITLDEVEDLAQLGQLRIFNLWALCALQEGLIVPRQLETLTSSALQILFSSPGLVLLRLVGAGSLVHSQCRAEHLKALCSDAGLSCLLEGIIKPMQALEVSGDMLDLLLNRGTAFLRAGLIDFEQLAEFVPGKMLPVSATSEPRSRPVYDLPRMAGLPRAPMSRVAAALVGGGSSAQISDVDMEGLGGGRENGDVSTLGGGSHKHSAQLSDSYFGGEFDVSPTAAPTPAAAAPVSHFVEREPTAWLNKCCTGVRF
jgi:hypothetical protein